ncbi:MAG: hypothetical protein CM1200mP4_3250 [Rhodospirillaceae bacterium]|nr:MAG: hypothetical protein CM1200mP4_3250 [Rhodospirillaceae bacterium]
MSEDGDLVDGDEADTSKTLGPLSQDMGQGGPIYRNYAEEYDEIVSATELCADEELSRLRTHLDQQLTSLQGVLLVSQTACSGAFWQSRRGLGCSTWRGLLDTARLARVVANPTYPLSYKFEKETGLSRYCCYIIIG